MRSGCLLLLILLGILVIAAIVLVIAALVGSLRETVDTRSLQHDLAMLEVPPAAVSGDADAPPPLSPSAAFAQGRIVLDLSVGEFRVEPGEPGQGIRVEARYDIRSYELEQAHESAPDGSWIHRIVFRQTGLLRDNGLRVLFGGALPQVRVLLPPDVPFALDGTFAKGGTNLELGGLWLTDVWIKAEKGGCDVAFSQPTVAPLQRVKIRSRQGGLSVNGIGNASPRRVEIDHRMGGMGVHLDGRWQRDADVRITSMMGGAGIVVPDGVRVESEGGPRVDDLLFGRPQREELPAPTLRLSTRGLWGRLHIMRLPQNDLPPSIETQPDGDE
jgi:hypothetical protein